MLDFMRRKAQSTYIQGTILIIILVFVFWGVGTSQKGGPESGRFLGGGQGGQNLPHISVFPGERILTISSPTKKPCPLPAATKGPPCFGGAFSGRLPPPRGAASLFAHLCPPPPATPTPTTTDDDCP